MKKIFLVLGLSLFLTACLPQDVQIPQSPLLSTLERKSGLIAYVGPEGNIYVSDQGGGQLKSITEDAKIPESETDSFRFYQTPTWSYDGKHLAYVGLSGEGTQITSEVYIASIEEDSSIKVFSETNEAPFYLYWAPDNENVSFLSSTTSGQPLILENVSATGGERVILDTGSPYYWSWAPDGHVMIVHAGGASAASAERLAFLEVGSEITEDGIEMSPGTFQAPAWSPDGSHILLAIKDDETGDKSIVVTNAAGEPQKILGYFAGEAAFAWSRDSEKVAYIASDQVIQDGLLGPLHVTNLDTSEEIVQDRKVLAFFWSPNSKRIAYFVPFLNNATQSDGEENSTNQNILLQLNVLDVETGENHEQFNFVPTTEFLSVLVYFDQYHQSNTIWSPDNNNLVLSFVDGDGHSGIAVVAASGQLEPRLLGPGTVAFWSWK